MTKNKLILIIDDVHEILIEGLTQFGYEVNYMPKATRSDLLHHISKATGLIVRTKTLINAEVMQAAPQLKFIARAGAGIDNIDEKFAHAQNIKVFNAGEANADAVGEHTLGMMLSLFAKINKSDKEVRVGIWNREDNRGEELSGKTVAIIGFGNTGKAVAQKLSGFNVKVLTYDKYLSNYSNKYATETEMEEIYLKADVLALHVPLNNDTKGLLDAEYLQKFVKPIWLFNMCRGEVVVMKDVVTAIENGKIKGAGFDVLENERLDNLSEQDKIWFNYIAKSEKTILSPHVAGWTKESYFKISTVLLKKILDVNLNESVS
jgi:D-3-phosphoglycerate dehydrogenase